MIARDALRDVRFIIMKIDEVEIENEYMIKEQINLKTFEKTFANVNVSNA